MDMQEDDAATTKKTLYIDQCSYIHVSILECEMSGQLTWNAQIINSHARERWECSMILDPPFQCIHDVLDVSGKVGIEFIMHELWLWLGQAWEVVAVASSVGVGME